MNIESFCVSNTHTHTAMANFIIVRKFVRTFTTEMTVSMVTRKFHLVAAKKEIFKLLFIYLISENAEWIHILYMQP
jgi:hypothetical protein